MLAYVVVGLNYEGKLVVYNRHKQWASADSSKARIYYSKQNADNVAKAATEIFNNNVVVALVQCMEIPFDFNAVEEVEVKFVRRS